MTRNALWRDLHDPRLRDLAGRAVAADSAAEFGSAEAGLQPLGADPLDASAAQPLVSVCPTGLCAADCETCVPVSVTEMDAAREALWTDAFTLFPVHFFREDGFYGPGDDGYVTASCCGTHGDCTVARREWVERREAELMAERIVAAPVAHIASAPMVAGTITELAEAEVDELLDVEAVLARLHLDEEAALDEAHDLELRVDPVRALAYDHIRVGKPNRSRRGK